MEKYMFALVNAINELLRKHVNAINNVGDTGTFGIGVELRQITSGPPRDATGRVLDAGVINIAAPNLANLALPVGRVFQDANYTVHFTGGYVANIPSPGLGLYGIAAVNIAVTAHITGQIALGFNGNVRWHAVESAPANEAAFFAIPFVPMGTEWDDYAAMAAAYGFLAPYNALATAVGLNSIQYTVVDR
jgi:hypothetical protein